MPGPEGAQIEQALRVVELLQRRWTTHILWAMRTGPVRLSILKRLWPAASKKGLRTAFHNARKRTPPKVYVVPYFPMVKETTVPNMRCDGVPQVIRMKISGHKTDSMERRYNIVDSHDLAVAKEFMERGMKLRKV